MSLIIQFNSSFIKTGTSNTTCHSKGKLEMVPGIERSEMPVMTDDEGSIIDIATSNTIFKTFKDVKNSHYCFGLPYQDHNYGAPPPDTPPSFSPCPSPVAIVAVAEDGDTNHSIASTTTEEAPEESITRCICGFEHDDEYMICCDQCLVWQHVDCMGLDRKSIPETYLCEKCEPRKLDKHKAKLLQARKKVVLIKIPQIKQEPTANNLVYGKNYKKKMLLQNMERNHKTDQGMTGLMTGQRFYGSTDSDEDNKNHEHRPKTRSKRRRKDLEKEHNIKKNRSLLKNGRERMEFKRSRLRRTKNKESTSTADEEAQDAWAFNTDWREENFESAVNNQYTPEVQHLARMIKPQGYEKKFYEQLQTKQCHILDDGKHKQLLSLYDIPRNQPLIEYKGKYLLASQFHDLHPLYNKRLYPYVLFYAVDQTDICVDSSMYGNDARFVRRSCKPNAEIRHFSHNGNLHLFLQSTKVIFSEDEITVPLNFNQCDSLKDFECACGAEDCLVKPPKKKNGFTEVCQEKRRRRTRQSTISADDEHSQPSVAAVVPVPEKTKMSPVKLESPIKKEMNEMQASPTETSEASVEMKASSSDHEAEKNYSENKKKMTREERKIDAYMRAFVQMEKAQRRKQMALEKQKALHPKQEEHQEKSEESIQLKEEEENSLVDTADEKSAEEEIKAQPPPPPPPPPPTVKPKKGKRRRGSGTPSRRRTRTSSGGSDIVLPSLDETPAHVTEQQLDPTPCLPPAQHADDSTERTCTTPNSISIPLSPTPAAESPKILKTKRLLLREWLQEKSDTETALTAAAPSPHTIHTEMKWNMTAASATCYVRCTKDTPHSGGISVAHLRRSNSAGHMKAAGGQGSAKKRWLRQAMNDCPEEALAVESSSMENLDCLSPLCHGDVDSPGASAEDIQTPLKKRRLMRESIESPHSPMDISLDDTSSASVNEMQMDLKVDLPLLFVANNNANNLPSKEEDTSEANGNAKEVDENETQFKDEIECDATMSDSISTEKDCFLKEAVEFTESKSSEEEQAVSQTSAEPDANDGQLDENPVQTNSDSVPDVNHSIQSAETIEEISLSHDCSVTPPKDSSLETESSATSECAELSTELKESEPPQSELAETNACNNLNSAKLSDIETVVNGDVLSQEDPLAIETMPSPVNSTQPIVDHKSLTNHVGSKGNQEKSTVLDPTVDKVASPPFEEQNGCISTPEESSQNINTERVVEAKKDNNDSNIDVRPSSLTPMFERTECVSSSCSNSIVSCQPELQSKTVLNEENHVQDSSIQTRCNASVDPSPAAKACASATQKRKVSLSEYRMRMKENGTKCSSEPVKKGPEAPAFSTSLLPDTLPEQVTLAPLPLFSTKDIVKGNVTKAPALNKSKETTSGEEEVPEHRENLNDRLKREFGFELSEGPSQLQNKSKCNNNQTLPTLDISKLLPPVFAQLPPPPPPGPPPRPFRSPLPVVGVVPPVPPQFGFVHPSYARPPPFMVPQVPPAPYMPNRPALVSPVLPPACQPTVNASPCNVRPPLLPSFPPTAVPAVGLLRPPLHPDYAHVNAQNFASVVSQPQLTHKAYTSHAYPTGLYK